MSYNAFSVVATTSGRVRELPIKDGQLIFVQDMGRVAFDFKGNRVFYNQITQLATEKERAALANPLNGYYFVLETACLWSYENKWIQITTPPEERIFIGAELPEVGQAKEDNLYVDTTNKEISIWDETTNEYVVVADKTDVDTVTIEDIDALFIMH